MATFLNVSGLTPPAYLMPLGSTAQPAQPARLNIGTVFRQNVQGVYNALNRQIGSYASHAELARGRIYTFAGESAGPPSEWKIKDWGVLQNAGRVLLKKGLVPVWVTPTQVDVAKGQASGGAGGLPPPSKAPTDGNPITLPAIDFPTLQLPGFPALGLDDTAKKWAIIGGIALLGVLIVKR